MEGVVMEGVAMEGGCHGRGCHGRGKTHGLTSDNNISKHIFDILFYSIKNTYVHIQMQSKYYSYRKYIMLYTKNSPENNS